MYGYLLKMALILRYLAYLTLLKYLQNDRKVHLSTAACTASINKSVSETEISL
jgi:hypothetical protein